jgi:hypothetical protein
VSTIFVPRLEGSRYVQTSMIVVFCMSLLSFVWTAVLLARLVPMARAPKHRPTRYVEGARGYLVGMDLKDDGRTLEQEVASGETEATPFVALTAVAAVVAALVVVSLVVVVLAYTLA